MPDRADSLSKPSYSGLSGGKPQRLRSAAELGKQQIYNRAGEKLGNVDEIMIELATGRVGYVVLSFGGFLGMGDKLFAVPWGKLAVDSANDRLILDVDKETLGNAPGFARNNWPDMADATWSAQIHQYYGSQLYADTDMTTPTGTTPAEQFSDRREGTLSRESDL